MENQTTRVRPDLAADHLQRAQELADRRVAIQAEHTRLSLKATEMLLALLPECVRPLAEQHRLRLDKDEHYAQLVIAVGNGKHGKTDFGLDGEGVRGRVEEYLGKLDKSAYETERFLLVQAAAALSLAQNAVALGGEPTPSLAALPTALRLLSGRCEAYGKAVAELHKEIGYAYLKGRQVGDSFQGYHEDDWKVVKRGRSILYLERTRTEHWARGEKQTQEWRMDDDFEAGRMGDNLLGLCGLRLMPDAIAPRKGF